MPPTLAPALVAPAINLAAIGPVLVLALTALVLLVLDLLPPRERKEHMGVVGLGGDRGARWWSRCISGAPTSAPSGHGDPGRFRHFFNLVIGFAVGPGALAVARLRPPAGRESGEFYILVILAAVGMILMAGAGDLIMVFLGLETMSLALYVLAGSSAAASSPPRPR